METSTFRWKDKRCLVTGAYGFVGTHLCRELLAREARITALDSLEGAEGTFFGHQGLDTRLETLRADVRSRRDLASLAGRRFDCVFHLAAQPISPLSNLVPEETMEINAVGTAEVGRAVASQAEQPRFVFASSACWYGATADSPLSETDPGAPGEYWYTESKVEAEKEVVRLESDHGIPTVRCRFVNLYGPGDRHFSRIVPKTIRHLLRGERPRLTRNDGTAILDYMVVYDAVSALLLAAENAVAFRGEVFNFGIGGEHPSDALNLVQRIGVQFDGKERDPIVENPTEPRTRKKFLDATKARRQLGWRPTRGLDRGLPLAIGWYQRHIDRIEHLEF